jgi:hypothetical protein
MKKTLLLLVLTCLALFQSKAQMGVPYTKKGFVISFANLGTTPRIKVNIDDDYEDIFSIQSFSDTTLLFKSSDEYKEYQKLYEKQVKASKERKAILDKIDKLKDDPKKTGELEKLNNKYTNYVIPTIDIQPYINNRTYLKTGMKVEIHFDHFDRTNTNVVNYITVITDFDKKETIEGVLEKSGMVAVVDGRNVKLDQRVMIVGGKRSKNGGSFEGREYDSFSKIDTGMELELEGYNQPDGIFLVKKATVYPYEVTDTDRILKASLKKSIVINMANKMVSVGRETFSILTDTAITNYVTKIGNMLIPSYLKGISDKSENYTHFDFYVVVDNEFNACAYPDGTVFVNTGLLSKVDNSSQLAAILGHELAHVTNKHGRKSYDKGQKKIFVEKVITYATNFFIKDTTILGLPKDQISLMLKTYGGPIFTSMYDRMYETQADRCGLSLMERAGFDPREGAKIWEILHQEASMEDKMNENDLLKKFTNKGSRMFLSLYNSHPETLQRYRNTNLLMALNYQEKDFSLDKKRYEQQTIEYRNFKLKLEHLLKLTKHSKEVAPTAKQQSNRVQEKVKSEEPAKGKTGLLDRIDKIKKTIK